MNEQAFANDGESSLSLTRNAPVSGESLNRSGGEGEVIRKVENFQPYNAMENSTSFERRTAAFIWTGLIVGVGGVVVAFACMLALWISNSSPVGWLRAGNMLVNTSTIFSALCLCAYPALYFARYQKRHDDRAHHVGGEYEHRWGQIQSLREHPLPVLRAVDRFYESRPAGLPGFLGSLFGTGVVTLTTLGAVAGAAKFLMDSKPGSNLDLGGFEILLAMFLFILVAAAIGRYAISRASYRRAVLSDAIKSIVAEENEEKGAV
ncbi:hypothetical protein [Luteibacter sp. CQ10]|uniref:hypothetical protein n=1 Tax=Luteibacter sp. CQ10 TaxID=2805821 RepID=UPI0034A25E61